MASYLVTGGAGFIGSHLTEELVRRGHRVRVADSLVTGKRSNLDHIPGIEFLEGDLAELDVARAAVDGCEYVLHQAAIPSVPRSVKDPITSNRANVDATLNTLVAARDAPPHARHTLRIQHNWRILPTGPRRGGSDLATIGPIASGSGRTPFLTPHAVQPVQASKTAAAAADRRAVQRRAAAPDSRRRPPP